MHCEITRQVQFLYQNCPGRESSALPRGTQLENVQAQAERQERDGQKQLGLWAFQRSYRILAKERRTDRTNQIHSAKSRAHRRALCSQGMLLCTQAGIPFAPGFSRAVPSAQLPEGTRTLLCQCPQLCQRHKSTIQPLGMSTEQPGSLAWGRADLSELRGIPAGLGPQGSAPSGSAASL